MPINVKPTIFVGFGGSGALVLQKLKYALAKQLSNSGETVPACFQFMAVDIDDSSANPRYEDSCLGFEGGSSHEMIIASLGGKDIDFSKLEDQIQRSAERGFPDIKEWWPKGLGTQLKKLMPTGSPDQAYQTRQVGRCALWLNLIGAKGFREHIISAERSVTDSAVLARIKADYPGLSQISANDGVNVIVVSSVAGGTGTGMLIDGLANIRALLPNSNIFTFLLMPSTYANISAHITEEDRRACKVNAYAALKEIDKCMREEQDVQWVEEYRKDVKVSFNVRLSTLTYLVCDKSENGDNLGGNPNRVTTKTAQYILNVMLGMQSHMDKGAGVHKLVAGTVKLFTDEDCRPVSKAYSSFGLYDFRYPQVELTEYAEYYVTKILLSKLTQAAPVGDARVVNRINELIHGTGERQLWQDQMIPYIQGRETSFGRKKVEDFAVVKRKGLLEKVFGEYSQSKRAIESYYNNLPKMTEKAVSDAQKWITGKVSTDFLSDRDYGLQAAIKFLTELRGKIKKYESVCSDRADENQSSCLKDSEATKLQAEYKDIGTYWLQSSRDQKLHPLLTKLKTSLSACDECNRSRLKAKIARSIVEEAIEPLKEVLDRLVEGLTDNLQMAITDAEYLLRELRELSGKNECFGCSLPEIQTLKMALKEEAAHHDAALRRELVNDYCWNTSRISPFAGTVVKKVLGDASILERIQGVTSDVPGYLAEKAKEAAPLCQYLGGEATQIAYYLIASFSEGEFIKVTGQSKIPGVTLASASHIDKHRITFMAVRHGMPAAHVAEVGECFKQYKAFGGIPIKQLPKINAHIHKDAMDWTELIHEAKDGIDVDAYIRICRKLGLLKRDTKGNWHRLFLGDTEDGVRGFNGLVNLRRVLSDEEGLAQAVQKAVVTKICEKFATNSTGFLSWSADNKVPEEIANEVKKRLALS